MEWPGGFVQRCAKEEKNSTINMNFHHVKLEFLNTEYFDNYAYFKLPFKKRILN